MRLALSRVCALCAESLIVGVLCDIPHIWLLREQALLSSKIWDKFNKSLEISEMSR